MTTLTTSLNPFSSLNRAPGRTWTDATKRKAGTSRSCYWHCWTWCTVA